MKIGCRKLGAPGLITKRRCILMIRLLFFLFYPELEWGNILILLIDIITFASKSAAELSTIYRKFSNKGTSPIKGTPLFFPDPLWVNFHVFAHISTNNIQIIIALSVCTIITILAFDSTQTDMHDRMSMLSSKSKVNMTFEQNMRSRILADLWFAYLSEEIFLIS